MDHHRGVATGPPGELAERTLGAWDAVLELAGTLRSEQLGRLAELGSWPERPVLGRLMAQAGAAVADRTGDAAADGAAAPAEAPRLDHSGEPRAEVLAALGEARRRVADALAEIAAEPALALVELDSALGPLPLLTQVHASAHELAVAALDCFPERAAARAGLPRAVGDAGTAALVDVVGALAYRQGVRADAGVWGPGTSGWVFHADAEGWRTERGNGGVPGIEGAAATVLGVPTGRAALPSLLAKGEIRLHRIGGLMALAPLVEQVPGLPGGALLRRAVGVVGLLGRLPGLQ
ncbi:hypothetical protein [Streptacidiphilus carbonis]|uniref:hypothetical protein n=1 Tax=Streptacidiphilus carbonis TaxID=105422 RepID=UPI0005A7AECF|nr:hypothetical protein [Streptacidiphilus carbonis]